MERRAYCRAAGLITGFAGVKAADPLRPL